MRLPDLSAPATLQVDEAVPQAHENLSAIAAAPKGCRPRRGRDRPLESVLALAPRRGLRGLDHGFTDAVDRPAVSLMSFVGVVAAGLALSVGFTDASSLRLLATLRLGPVRPMTALMVVPGFSRKAGEERLH